MIKLMSSMVGMLTVLVFTPVAAQQRIPSCVYLKKEIPVKVVNDFSIICRDINPDEGFLGRTRAIDVLTIYEWDIPKKDIASIASITVFSYGLRLATFAEFKQEYCVKPSISPCSKSTQLWLRDRQFDEWANEAQPELLERQREKLSLLLDALEQYPRTRPSF